MAIIIVLTGLSGAGKSFLEQFVLNDFLFKNKLEKVVSFTTRPLRQGEIDGKDYHFVTEQEFLNLQKRDFFLEQVTYSGCHYGAPKNIVTKLNQAKNLLITTDLQGAIKLKNLIQNPHQVLVVFVTAPQTVIQDRLKKRGHDQEFVSKRLVQNQTDLQNAQNHQAMIDLTINSLEKDVSVKMLTDFLTQHLKS